MQKIKLYWNHICVLHNKEKEFLNNLVEKLKVENIDLDITFFGLGYESSMSKYLEQDDAILPDIIISADLEVFEYTTIFSKFENDLYDLCSDSSLFDEEISSSVFRNSKLLPFAGIPLVYFTTEPESLKDKNLCDVPSLSIGGINNSAIKTIVKTAWENYGKEAVKNMLENALIAPMPVVAFSNVKKTLASTCLVPALYAMRADNETEFMCIPKEGPLIIPSFVCARNSVPYHDVVQVLQSIICTELCDFYVENGNLITFSSVTTKENIYKTDKYFTTTNEFFNNVTCEEFYNLYVKSIPEAYVPKALIKNAL